MKLFFKIITILFLPLHVLSQTSSAYVIASGSKGGNYYNTGSYISQKLSIKTHLNFINIESEGSVNNIELLKENIADFAIVQRNTLLQSYYDEQNGINNFEIVLPLFVEKFFIYHFNKDSINLDRFIKQLSEKKVKIGFTSKSSYSYKIFRHLSRFNHFNYDNVIEQFDNYNALMQQLKTGKIDYLVSFSLPLMELENDNVNRVLFISNELEIISHKEPNIFPTLDDTKNNTLGSWTFLIAQKEVLDKLSKENIPNIIISDINQNNFIESEIFNSFKLFEKSETNGEKFLEGLPLSNHLMNAIKYKPIRHKGLYFVLGVVLFFMFLIFLLKQINYKDYFDIKYLSFRYRHIFIGIIVLILVYLLSIEVMLIAERDFYSKMALKSQILNMSYEELNKWLIFKKLNGDDMGVYPFSFIGKVMLTFTTYSLFLGVLIIVMFEYITYKNLKKKRSGLMNTPFKKHIVITGWNDSTHNFIKDAVDKAMQNKSKEKIVCVVPDTTAILDRHPTMSNFSEQNTVYFRNGDLKDPKTLESVKIHQAKTVVLFAEDNTVYSDEKTLLRALSIYRFCDEKNDDNTNRKKLTDKGLVHVDHFVNPVHIIAEINDPKFKRLLIEADVNEVIVTSEITKSLLTQSMFKHSISKVLEEIVLSQNDSELFFIDLKEKANAKFIGKTFDELLLPLRKQNILLIAIRVVFRDEFGVIIDDNKEIDELLDLHQGGRNIDREFLVNPNSDEEKNRRTDGDDQLVVLAESKDMIRKGVSNVIL